MLGAAGSYTSFGEVRRRGVVLLASLLSLLVITLIGGELVVQSASRNPGSSSRLRLAAALHPGDVTPWWTIAQERGNKGDVKGRLAALDEVTARDGLNRDVWLTVARAREDAGDVEGALSDLRSAVAVDPVGPTNYRILADAYARHGRLSDAFEAIDRGLEIRLRAVDRKFPELELLAQFGQALAIRHGDQARADRYGEILDRLAHQLPNSR
jgi:cytochrome c-type biogenesis protein CcmH/NrfG